MEMRLKVLELFLEALGENTEISSFDDRLRVQKAVYLGQLFGADLGYRYSWYIKGPYSSSLTQDYFDLNQQTEDAERWILNKDLSDKLARARQLLELPSNQPNLTKVKWYELLASLHYLQSVSKMDEDAVKRKIQEVKPHLVEWIDIGLERLRSFQLIN